MCALPTTLCSVCTSQPENFLFLDDGPDAPLKMIDFGIAEYCDEGQELHDRAGGGRNSNRP